MAAASRPRRACRGQARGSGCASRQSTDSSTSVAPARAARPAAWPPAAPALPSARAPSVRANTCLAGPSSRTSPVAEQHDPRRAAGQAADVVGNGQHGQPGPRPHRFEQAQERRASAPHPGRSSARRARARRARRPAARPAPAAACRPGSAPTGSSSPGRGSRRSRSRPRRRAPGRAAARGTCCRI